MAKASRTNCGIDPARAHDPDDPHVGGVLHARDARQVGRGVGAPVAEEGHDARFPVRRLVDGFVVGSDTRSRLPAPEHLDLVEDLLVLEQVLLRSIPDGHAATQVPQPLHSASLISAFLLRPRTNEIAVYGHSGDARLAAGAVLLVDVGGVRLQLDVARVDERQRLGGGGPGLRHACRGCPWAPGRQPARKTPSVKVFTGASFGCRSRKKPSVAQEMLNSRRTSCGIGLRLQADATGRPCRPGSGGPCRSACPPPGRPACLPPAAVMRPVGHLGHAAADEVHAFLQQPVVELLVALARGPHVDVEVVDLGVRCAP